MGRPKLTYEKAAIEAARVISIAFALRYRPSALASLGFKSTRAAAAYVLKRRRGLIGDLIGDSVREFWPAINAVQAGVSLVLDHDFSIQKAAKLTKSDPSNIQKALKAGREARKHGLLRAQSLSVRITDADQ